LNYRRPFLALGYLIYFVDLPPTHLAKVAYLDSTAVSLFFPPGCHVVVTLAHRTHISSDSHHAACGRMVRVGECDGVEREQASSKPVDSTTTTL
jgi:hypothetical protein